MINNTLIHFLILNVNFIQVIHSYPTEIIELNFNLITPK